MRGSRNIDGWGMGTYADGHALVVRSEAPAMSASAVGGVSSSFRAAVQAARSSVLVGHLRLSSRGALRKENNHPFCLSFLAYDWLLVHNGTAVNHHRLMPPEQRLLVESDSDSARVFEFLRRQVIEYYLSSFQKSLIWGWRHAFDALLNTDGGTFNIIVSNGYLSFVLVHWRRFYCLHREKEAGDAVLVSTLRLSDDEEWVVFEKRDNTRAKLLAFAGHSLVYNGDIR